MQKGQDSRSLEKSKIFLGADKRKKATFLVVLTLVVVFDQLSKLWVRSNLPQIELIPGFLDLVYVENSGSAFGLLANQTFLLVTITIVSLIIIPLFFHYLSPSGTWGILSAALILSGAVGNLIDRLRFGHVTDFIELHLKELFYWPAFNLADTAIVIGVITLIYSLYQSALFRKAYEHNHKAKN